MRHALITVLLAGLASAAAAQEAPPGALSCSGCHDDGPEATLPLADLTATEIADALEAFRTGARTGTIMDRIARGFTAEESAAIADWIGAEMQ